MIPFDSVAICQCFLSVLEGCTFLRITHVLLSFPVLGIWLPSVPVGNELPFCCEACLLINLSGRFLLRSQEEVLIQIAHVSILCWLQSLGLQKMFNTLAIISFFQLFQGCQRTEMAGTISRNRKNTTSQPTRDLTQINYELLASNSKLFKREVDLVKSSSICKDLEGNKPQICISVAM